MSRLQEKSVRGKRSHVVTKFSNSVVNNFGTKKSTPCSQVLVLPELFVNRIQRCARSKIVPLHDSSVSM